MKAIKKLMAALLAVAMLCAIAVPAFAVGENTPSIKAPDNGHTYEVYQIFTGSVSVDTGKKVLTDVKWGKNADSTHSEGTTVEESVLDELEALANSSDEQAILTTVKKYVNLKSNPLVTLTNGQKEQVAAGYYLIKDKDNSLPNNTADQSQAYTLYLVEIVDGEVTINPKTDAPTVEKKVKENSNKFTGTEYGEGYNDTADYSIGDSVPFKLIGSVPDMSHFQSYKYEFYDTLADSFNMPAETEVKAYLVSSKSEECTENNAIDSSAYTVNVSGHKIEVKFNNLKSVNGIATGKYVVVRYDAVLNSSASIGKGTPGNTNEVYLKYSNNPNQEGEGQTPVDKVIVFTYELDVTKIDGQDHEKKLPNAEFVLKNAAGKYATVDTTSYKLTGWVDSQNEATTLTSDANGLFKVIGLDDGTYYLKETKAPTGYNPVNDDIKIVITANTSNGQNGSGAVGELTAITVTVGEKNGTGNVENGTVGVEVENNMGATLPGTGGIGTTIFYIIGGGLMVAAVVLLITKKRMEKNN